MVRISIVGLAFFFLQGLVLLRVPRLVGVLLIWNQRVLHAVILERGLGLGLWMGLHISVWLSIALRLSVGRWLAKTIGRLSVIWGRGLIIVAIWAVVVGDRRCRHPSPPVV